MSKEQVLHKLLKKFEHVPTSEEDIVYILSRIRKILEMDGYPEEYIFLNFYCNLALHSIIDRVPKKVSDKLRDLGADNNYDIAFFVDFHKELNNFLVKYGLPNFYDNKPRISDFNSLLHAIYSDTPIVIGLEDGTKYKTTFHEDGFISGSPVG